MEIPTTIQCGELGVTQHLFPAPFHRGPMLVSLHRHSGTFCLPGYTSLSGEGPGNSVLGLCRAQVFLLNEAGGHLTQFDTAWVEV